MRRSPWSGLHQGSHDVPISEIPASNPGRVNVEK